MTKKDAKPLVMRFSVLDRFPQDAIAINELVEALLSAETNAIAEAYVDDVINTEVICPKPAHIRIALYDRAQELRAKRKACSTCGGVGSLTQWFLVTYRGNSLTPKTAIRLDVATPEQANAFATRIAGTPLGVDFQDILSAARDCPACSGNRGSS